MTEDEAKQKYCPLAPLALGTNGTPTMTSVSYGYYGSSGAGYATPMRQYSCQGSACMMWRGDGCGLVQR